MKNWTEIYKPRTLEEIKGQDLAITQIKKFLKDFPKKKAMLLNGPPGVGKTTLVQSIANSIQAEIFELNASDFRNKDSLNERLKPALEQSSLVKKSKIILVDEVDGISAVDRGGLTEIVKLIELSNFPIIATANNAWARKLAPLRKAMQTIDLKPIKDEIAKKLILEILEKENKKIKPELLEKIIKSARGDMRAIINDVQSVSLLGENEEVEIFERNKETDIFHILKQVFQEKADEAMLSLFDKTEMPMEEITLWIEDNIPLVYKGEELARAYERLSRADIFKGRIYRQQYWRFMVYQNILMSYGIAQAKHQSKSGFFKYKKPDRVLKIWLANQKNEKKKSISEKYSTKVHVGTKRIIQDFKMILPILKNPTVQKELRLDEEEIAYLSRS